MSKSKFSNPVRLLVNEPSVLRHMNNKKYNYNVVMDQFNSPSEDFNTDILRDLYTRQVKYDIVSFIAVHLWIADLTVGLNHAAQDKKIPVKYDVTYVNDTFLDVYVRDMPLAHSKAPVCLF